MREPGRTDPARVRRIGARSSFWGSRRHFPVAARTPDVPHQRDSLEVLDRDFLEIRAKILEIAASLDRIDRAPARHGEHPDPRLAQVRQALDALGQPGPDRAETIQLIFSLSYDAAWQDALGVVKPKRG